MTPPKDYNARYCTDKQWYRRTPDGEWINVTEGKLNQHLILQGVWRQQVQFIQCYFSGVGVGLSLVVWIGCTGF